MKNIFDIINILFILFFSYIKNICYILLKIIIIIIIIVNNNIISIIIIIIDLKTQQSFVITWKVY